jgi:FkbM family methyltransferase
MHLNKYLQNNAIVIFDIGAKNGVKELNRLSSFCEVYGFEPNPQEFLKLKNYKSGKYKKEEYSEVGLSDFTGEILLNVSENSSFSSFLNTDWVNYQLHFGFMEKVEEWKKDLAKVSEIKVQVSTLDFVSEKNNVSQIDFLKLDTQGTELRVLKGAEKLLGNNAISMIKSEVSFINVYENQNTFSEIDTFLKSHNFRFVDCLFYRDVIHEKPKKEFINTKTREIYEPIRYSAGGDAIWMIDFEKVNLKNRTQVALKSGIILAEAGYYSLAYNTLKYYANLSEEDAFWLLQYFTNISFKQKIKHWIVDWMPPVLLRTGKTILRK